MVGVTVTKSPVVPKSFTYLEKRNPAANELKFWVCRFEPTPSKVSALHVWWGRIGTKGQEKVFTYASDEECLRDTRKRAEEKIREGYAPVSGTLSWWPEFLKWADLNDPRVPKNEDGWPIVDGFERRPPVRGRFAQDREIVEAQERRTRAIQEAERVRAQREFKPVWETGLDKIRERATSPSPRPREFELISPRDTRAPLVERERGIDMARSRDRTAVTVVQISNDRVIDFED